MPTNVVLRDSLQPHPLRRSTRSTLQEQLVEIIGKQIENGIYSPGDKLPSVRALADAYEVSRETAKIALNILRDQGTIEILPSRGAYVRNIPGMRTETRKGSICYLVDLGPIKHPSMSINTVYETLLQDVEGEVVSRGNHLLTSYISFEDQGAEASLNALVEKVDGIIAVALINQKLLDHLVKLPIPVVSLLSNIDVGKIDEIEIEAEKTYYSAARTLLEEGHRRLIYLDGPFPYFQQERRRTGIARAVAEFPDAEMIMVHADGWTPDTVPDVVHRALMDFSEADALICVNDVIAAGALRGCIDAGRRVPEDISIVGGKDTLFSLSSNPQLTSIKYHYDEMARMAADRLMRRINGEDLQPTKMQLMGTMVQRDSCRCRSGSRT